MQHLEDSALDQHVARAHPASPEHAARSHAAASRRLDEAIRTERLAGASRRRTGRRIATGRIAVGTVAVAACALVAVALAPSNEVGSAGRPTLTIAPESASAAEVLERAATVLARDGVDGVGSGPVWHSSGRATHGGTLRGYSDTWYDPATGAARWTMLDSYDGTSLDWLYVYDVTPDGRVTIRQYRRDEATGEWTADVIIGQIDQYVLPIDEEAAKNLPEDAFIMPPAGAVESATLAWLKEVESTEDPAVLDAATRRFMARTDDGFTFDALKAEDLVQAPVENSAAATAEATAAGEGVAMLAAPGPGGRNQDPDELKPLQVLHLVKASRINPDAMARLYRLAAEGSELKRLGSTTVDGRAAERIQLWDSGGLDMVNNVLVIDSETGQPLQTEEPDGSGVDRLQPARRVATLEGEATTCGTTEGMPSCDLVAGRGPLAEEATRLAAMMTKRSAELQAANPGPVPALDPDSAPAVAGPAPVPAPAPVE